jgi:hypothetical protein
MVHAREIDAGANGHKVRAHAPNQVVRARCGAACLPDKLKLVRLCHRMADDHLAMVARVRIRRQQRRIGWAQPSLGIEEGLGAVVCPPIALDHLGGRCTHLGDKSLDDALLSRRLQLLVAARLQLAKDVHGISLIARLDDMGHLAGEREIQRAKTACQLNRKAQAIARTPVV